MTKYLDYTFKDDENFISTFDEAPLWSASFGLLLLKHLDLGPNLKVIDIGSGAGFPLLELAGRLGDTCRLFGVDPWKTANARTRQKIKAYGYTHVELYETSAEHLPFEDASVDLIVSNLGINNFEHPEVVFKECYRVLKPNGKLAISTNLNGHWKEFYKVFYATLKLIGKDNQISRIEHDEAHRGNIDTVSKLFTDQGFRLTKKVEDSFDMKFVDGSAFLNHHFVKLGWLSTWMGLLPKEEWQVIFSALESGLNQHSKIQGGLCLAVPMLYIEGKK